MTPYLSFQLPILCSNTIKKTAYAETSHVTTVHLLFLLLLEITLFCQHERQPRPSADHSIHSITECYAQWLSHLLRIRKVSCSNLGLARYSGKFSLIFSVSSNSGWLYLKIHQSRLSYTNIIPNHSCESTSFNNSFW